MPFVWANFLATARSVYSLDFIFGGNSLDLEIETAKGAAGYLHSVAACRLCPVRGTGMARQLPPGLPVREHNRKQAIAVEAVGSHARREGNADGNRFSRHPLIGQRSDGCFCRQLRPCLRRGRKSQRGTNRLCRCVVAI